MTFGRQQADILDRSASETPLHRSAPRCRTLPVPGAITVMAP